MYTENDIIEQAIAILAKRVASGPVIESPQAMRDYLVLSHAKHDVEHFGVVFLDAKHCIIENRVMFTGTLTQTSVYPREVVRAALAVNCAAVIFHHNHPSGSPEPSAADENLTNKLKTALSMVDVRVLDHVVCGAGKSVSFAERGLL